MKSIYPGYMMLHGLRSVSYTHLDVYKRQGLLRMVYYSLNREKWNGLANGKTESIKFLTPFACATIAAN